MQSGLYYGYIGLVDGILERIFAELGQQAARDCNRRTGADDLSGFALHLGDRRHCLRSMACAFCLSAIAQRGRAGAHTRLYVLNYFNYFTEIEERFQQRRGAILLLSTLDWALIETWRDAGIPLEAVLRGIDAAFDKYESRQKRGRMRRVNGLAWCSQAVMEAAEELREASAGTATPTTTSEETGFEHERVAVHLETAASALDASTIAHEACAATAVRLRELGG